MKKTANEQHLPACRNGLPDLRTDLRAHRGGGIGGRAVARGARLLTIIVILGGSLVYEIAQRHRAARGQVQFEVANFVQLYQNLDRGEVDAAKRRLGALVIVQTEVYEKHFGRETDTEFAPMLAEANTIKTVFDEKYPSK